MDSISKRKVREMEERAKINVIMELSYRADDRKRLKAKEIEADYFPGIFKIISYGESEIPRMIKEVIEINTVHDKWNLKAIEDIEKSEKRVKSIKIAYLVTEDAYKEYSKEFFGEEHDLYDDMNRGIFFMRTLHEEIITKFFNSKEYINELKSEGLLAPDKLNTIHTIFTTKETIKEALSENKPNDSISAETNKSIALYIRTDSTFNDVQKLKNRLEGLNVDRGIIKSTGKALEYIEIAANYLSDVTLKLLKEQGVDFNLYLNDPKNAKEVFESFSKIKKENKED